jgi:ORMDL family
MFHWVKGCPDASTQGEYNGFTLYEQLDAGIPWTSTKKFLMLMPTLITWMACYIADYKPIYIVVNCGMFLILIIGKIPEMHRVRIFGINSTAGIDTKIEYSPSPSPSNRKKAL